MEVTLWKSGDDYWIRFWADNQSVRFAVSETEANEVSKLGIPINEIG